MEKGYHDIDIDKLVKAGWNYKENNDALMEKLINNIKRNGQIENIIVRELDTGFFEVVNGNHRLDALNAIGSKTVYCYNLGQISESQAKRIAVETNETKFQSSEESLAGILREIIDEFDDFDITSPFSEEELNELLGDIDVNIEEDGTIEEVEENEVLIDENNINTKLGDIYELNNHRLICWDCTDKEVVEKLFDGKTTSLVVTDPPYGVDYGEKNKKLNDFQAKNGKTRGTRMERDIKNDAIEDYRKFFADFMSIIPFSEINSFYAFISSQNLHNLRLAFDDAKMYFSSYLVWLKNQHVISWIDYMFKTETILYGWKGKHKFYGATNSMNVFEFDKPVRSKLHLTMKPVELIMQLIKNSSLENEIVYDAFSGSGTTLIASEETNRVCYNVELDEKHCDVAVKRWVQYMKSRELDFCVKLNGIDVSNENWINETSISE